MGPVTSDSAATDRSSTVFPVASFSEFAAPLAAAYDSVNVRDVTPTGVPVTEICRSFPETTQLAAVSEMPPASTPPRVKSPTSHSVTVGCSENVMSRRSI